MLITGVGFLTKKRDTKVKQSRITASFLRFLKMYKRKKKSNRDLANGGRESKRMSTALMWCETIRQARTKLLTYMTCSLCLASARLIQHGLPAESIAMVKIARSCTPLLTKTDRSRDVNCLRLPQVFAKPLKGTL